MKRITKSRGLNISHMAALGLALKDVKKRRSGFGTTTLQRSLAIPSDGKHGLQSQDIVRSASVRFSSLLT